MSYYNVQRTDAAGGSPVVNGVTGAIVEADSAQEAKDILDAAQPDAEGAWQNATATELTGHSDEIVVAYTKR